MKGQLQFNPTYLKVSLQKNNIWFAEIKIFRKYIKLLLLAFAKKRRIVQKKQRILYKLSGSICKNMQVIELFTLNMYQELWIFTRAFSKKNICWHKSYQLFNIIFSWITFSGKIMSKVYTLDVDGFMVWFCHKLWNQHFKGYATFKNYARDFVKK